MKKVLLFLLIIYFQSVIVLASNPRIVDYIGTYSLDIEKMEEIIKSSNEHENIWRNVRLIIRKDGDLIWGGGKTHLLKLERDFNNAKTALFIEEINIAGKSYVTRYLFHIRLGSWSMR